MAGQGSRQHRVQALRCARLEHLFVIASFLEDKAKQHKVEPNKVMIGLNYGELRLERYDEGAYEKWKVLERIKPRF